MRRSECGRRLVTASTAWRSTGLHRHDREKPTTVLEALESVALPSTGPPPNPPPAFHPRKSPPTERRRTRPPDGRCGLTLGEGICERGVRMQPGNDSRVMAQRPVAIV